MSELNINVEGGSSTKLLTAGKYCPDDIIITASGGGGAEVEPIVLTDSQTYGCSGDLASAYIKLYGDKITTKDLTNTGNMFLNYKNETIPFEINMDGDAPRSMNYMFNSASNLKELPKINDAYPAEVNQMFYKCYKLREIPDEVINNWNFDRIQTYNWSNNSNMCYGCYSLRSVSKKLLSNIWGITTTAGSTPYYYAFYNCYSIDELKDIAVHPAIMTTNMFYRTFDNCWRLKELTFITNEDGSPKTAQWKGQRIDLNTVIGYMNDSNEYTFLKETDFTSVTKVDNDTKYNELKDNPDYWGVTRYYSRYNHDSAVNTINSLPDTSAYLATAGGNNSITFTGTAGGQTDGGKIESLTEEEIAVATSKGWTVHFG